MSQTGLRFTVSVGNFPAETFAVTRFHLFQSYSSLFTLDIHTVSERTTLQASELLEQTAQLAIWQGDTPLRYVTGLIAGIERGEYDGRKTAYSLTVRPPFWRSSLRQNFRHFQQQDIQAIIQRILDDNRVIDTAYLLDEAHPAREFCVQYGETDYEFLCRLLAEEGMFFYEEHARKGTRQMLVFCDRVVCLPDAFPLPFNPQPRSTTTECINRFRHSAQIRPAYVIAKDYTFKAPGWQARYRNDATSLNGQRNQYEVLDYPGRFKDEQHGRDFARYQTEGRRNDAETASGSSNSPKLWPGARFTLTDHPVDDLNREWQVTASELHGEQPQAMPGTRHEGTTLVNDFQAVPADKTWRPAPLPKPKVDGPQPAVVTGPEGEEIFCDEHGRVRVKFLWDRYHKANEDSSCWIRVSQPWAGAGFGHLAIPRVGQEVIVDFLNGDPDQPIIMGRTYHQDYRSPGSLPGTKTQMTIRSKTYKGDGFNELRFEDATGREEVYIHAQKDMNHIINHDRTSPTKRHSVDKVQGNSAVLVGDNQVMQVSGTQNTNIGGDYVLSVGRGFVDGYHNMNLANFQDGAASVLKKLAFSAGSHGLVPGVGNMTTFVQGSRMEHINITDTTSVTGAKIINAGAMVSISAGTRLSLTSSGNSKEICGGVKIIQATDRLELHVGSSSLILTSDGQIELAGLKMIINGSDEILIKSPKVNIEGE
ncbi:type VI secretion system tip protein TssI/VgrG [Citrobacter freundii]|uniref:type VI secretion system tip protein TssI/VgrG n=1 Tax=Citrobacter freundii TaxID=546 RepID=UPI00190411E6|nr:type VI secretion system tip protein TssI/VgrG [Citrobacter freundii]MBJ9196363.1 type VI secretion system tip protein VgrG [Citrobacter freundii]